ncbi:diguanylate cyclase [Thalassospira sp. HF15]|uniref:diguanylate cyclase domain-containing protein n=1 Tax=Thalassospira sp. HF15 TaxID=2722755 RepID=UPI00143202E1|nr:diguanylate cyclase [Thalassospira sp. HF15]
MSVNLTSQTGSHAGAAVPATVLYEFFRNDPSRNYVGAGLLDLLGYDPVGDEFDRAQGWGPLIHPDDADTFAKTAKTDKSTDQTTVDGTQKRATFRLRHKNGDWVAVEDCAISRTLATGEVVTSGCLTELERGADLSSCDGKVSPLRNSDKLHKRLLDSLAEGVVVHDANGAVVEFNNTALEILGLTSDELTHKVPLRDGWGFIREDGTPLARGELPGRTVLVTGKREYGVVLGIKRPDDAFAWIRVNAEPLHNEEAGTFDGVVVSFADITDVKQAEAAFRERGLLYRQMFSNTTAVNILVDPEDGRIVDASQAAEALYDFADGGLVGRKIPDLDVDGAPSLHKHVADVFEKGVLSFVVRHRLGNGEIRKMEVHAGVIELHERKYIHTTNVDITDREHYERMLTDANRKLDEERQRLNEIIWATNAGTWEWNVRTGETRFNERWAEIIGYTLEELEPVSIDTWLSHAHPEDLEKSEALLHGTFNSETEYYECECRMRHKNGSWVWVLDRGKVVEWDEEGKPLRMSGTHADITPSKAVEAEIRRLAQTDQLTGLSNRYQFNSMLSQIIEINKRFEKKIVLMLLDLDRFKAVNDTFGHPVGDKLLVEVGKIIKRNCREADVVARLGGDEFAVVLPLMEDVRDATIPAQRIIDEVSRLQMIDGNEVHVGISIGISTCADHNANPDSIYRDADKALYRAKNCGRNRFCFFVEGSCNDCSCIDAKLCGRNAVNPDQA